jgi:hypothetical protein
VSLQLLALAVLSPLLFFGGLVAARWRSGRYLSARLAMIMAIAVVLLAGACAWLADQFLMPWYIPISSVKVRLIMDHFQLVGFLLIAALAVESGGIVGQAIKRRRWLTRGQVALLLTSIAILPAIFGVSQTGRWLSRGTHEALLTNFQRHEVELRRIAEMAVEDGRFWRIAPDTSPARPTARHPLDGVVDPLPAERREEYRALLRSTDVRDGLLIYDGGRRVEFLSWYRPLTLDRVDRGYVYLADPPGPVTTVTHDGWIRVREKDGSIFYYRHIADRWYLFDIQW